MSGTTSLSHCILSHVQASFCLNNGWRFLPSFLRLLVPTLPPELLRWPIGTRAKVSRFWEFASICFAISSLIFKDRSGFVFRGFCLTGMAPDRSGIRWTAMLGSIPATSVGFFMKQSSNLKMQSAILSRLIHSYAMQVNLFSLPIINFSFSFFISFISFLFLNFR